jgi:hypothetical protein
MDKNMELTSRATIENALNRNKSMVKNRDFENQGSGNSNGGQKSSRVVNNVKNEKKFVQGSSNQNKGNSSVGGSQKKHDFSNVICFKCNGKGHFARDCKVVSNKPPVIKVNPHTTKQIHDEYSSTIEKR